MADYMTVEQAAQELGLSVRMVQYLITTGEIEASKYDATKATSPWMIVPASLKSYAKKRKTGPLKQPK